MTRCRLDVDPEGWTVRPRTRQTRKEPTMPSQPDDAVQETAMTTTPQRIDEIRDRLNKAHPGLAKIDGGEEILKRRGNPKGVYTWTLYGPYADAILLVNAPDDLAWLLGEVERLSAALKLARDLTHEIHDLTDQEDQ